MTKKKNKLKYPKMNFDVDQFSGCCGIGIICRFRTQGEYDWGLYRHKSSENLFATKEEQVDQLYQDILKESWGVDAANSYSQLMCALVSNYKNTMGEHERGSHQFQELEDKLLAEGWTIHSVFINTNHGNEITLYGKYFPERDTNPYDEDDYEDEDEEDEVPF